MTTAKLRDDPRRDDPLLVLDAEDPGTSRDGGPPSGVGVTYYRVNGTGPGIYTAPLSVEAKDVVT